MKTARQVREELRRRGQTVAHWARTHGFEPDQVRDVLYGRAKGYWGESHKIAVTLGMKDGEIVEEGSELYDQRSAQNRPQDKQRCNTFSSKGVAKGVAVKDAATPRVSVSD